MVVGMLASWLISEGSGPRVLRRVVTWWGWGEGSGVVAMMDLRGKGLEAEGHQRESVLFSCVAVDPFLPSLGVRTPSAD